MLSNTSFAQPSAQTPLRHLIPSTGERIPVIGMGSWLTFDVGDDAFARGQRRKILQVFFEQGGTVIDSSPMYGSSEEVIGDLLPRLNGRPKFFSASKVWTVGRQTGIKQMESSQRLWGIAGFDLLQIHNMLDWETHVRTLKAWKDEGRVRYIGITTSHGRRHEALETALRQERFDFVQFTYNILNRETEQRLLPLAAERGCAVIINRPFDGGSLFHQVRGRALPAWVAEFDCQNWAQYFLKFVISHPAVTCAIPATSQAAHMMENMGANFGVLPDQKVRRKMIEYFSKER